MEIVEFVGQDVGVWNEIVMLVAELLLHFDKVEAKSILPRDLITHWEVINSLILIKAFIHKTLARTR